MKYDEVISRIDKYINSDKNQPIIVDLPNIKLYDDLVRHYQVGCYSTQKVSEFCVEDGLPIMDKLQHSLSIQDGVVFLIGLSCYAKLQGEIVLKKSLRSLLELSCKGKLVVLTLCCRTVLEKMDMRFTSAGRISIVDGLQDSLPTLYFIAPKLADFVSLSIKGIHRLEEMKTFLEDGCCDINFITSRRKEEFSESLYNIVNYSSSYQVLAENYSDFANIGCEVGSEANWNFLLKELESCEDWHQYVVDKFGNIANLSSGMSGFAEYDSNKKWAYFLALKTYGVKDNEYLAYVISKSKTIDDFIMMSFCAILDISVEDNSFERYYAERKSITSRMGEYVDSLDVFCKRVYSKAENAIYYLTDNTRREKEHIIELIVKYKYSIEKLSDLLPKVYNDLAIYLKPYNYPNDFLNMYFSQYKYCKVVNVITAEMSRMVDEQSVKREYNIWLQPRSLYVDNLTKNPANSVLYFMDAMGAEYLGYLQSKCYDNGLAFAADVARCSLPSITSVNKEFVDEFKLVGSKVYCNKEMDELKHGGAYTYDYENNKLPIHIVEELDVLDKLVDHLKSMPKEQTAYVVADHGASRLAVINECENKWEVSEKGLHSGRCCPKSDISDKPQFAAEENDFWCLANYDRFRGGRKALVEVHGGATLEEIAVPVITIRKNNSGVICRLVTDRPIIVSFKKKARLDLFVDIDSEDMTILVNGVFYALKKTEIKYQYYAEMPEVKTVGQYECDVYNGDALISKGIKFEVKKEGVSVRKFF